MNTPFQIRVDERHVIEESYPCGLFIRTTDGSFVGRASKQQPYPRWPIGGLIMIGRMLATLGFDLPSTTFRNAGNIVNERMGRLLARAKEHPRRGFVAYLGNFQVRWNPETDRAEGDWTFIRPAATPREIEKGEIVTEHPSEPRLLAAFVIERVLITNGGTYDYGELDDAFTKLADQMLADLRIVEGEEQ